MSANSALCDTRRADLPSLSLSYLSRQPDTQLAEASPHPVICLHGFPDSPRCWSALLGDLSRAGHPAYAPWLRGYAPSSLHGPYDVERLARDVIEFADHVSPTLPVSLVGHDWGAVISYAALALRPDRFRRAVTMAVPHPLNFRRRASLKQLRRSWYMLFFQSRVLPERIVPRDDYALIDRLWRDWSPAYSPSPSYMTELKQCLAASMPAPLGYYRALPQAAAGMRALQRAMREIQVPLLYLHGSQDGCIGWELMLDQERYFSAEHQSELLGGVGHFMQLENPGAVNSRVLDWLGRD